MSKKIKTLHVYKTALPSSTGGIEVFMDGLCNATADLGVDNTIFSLADNPSCDPISLTKYKIVQAKQNFFLASTGFSFSAFFKFSKLAIAADIIHYYFPNPFADLLHFACRIKKPTVVTYQSDVIKQKQLLKFYRPLMNKFLGSVDSIVSTSPNYFATSDVLQKFSQKTTVIPIGLDKSAYPPVNVERLRYWQERFPQPFFLFVGVLRYYKGLHYVLDAVSGTNIQLAIAGTGGIEDELKTHVKRDQLDNVQFLGFIDTEDKVALLHLCCGFVLPSHLRSEAFGISLLEAAAYAKPLISCEIGTGTSFVNIDKETGLVVEPSSPKALRYAMQYLLEHPDKAAEFGNNAQKRHKKYFTAERQARAYYHLYQDLLGG